MTVAKPIDSSLPRSRVSHAGQSQAGTVEQLLRRFATEVRPRARKLVRSSPRTGDLATAFPGALHVLADPCTDEQRRKQSLLLVDGGAPLKDVAEALGLALWMRRLPPEAFHGGLPTLAKSDGFARRIVNRLPTTRRTSRFWFESIAFASNAADDDFAIWLADKIEGLGHAKPEELLRVLAAYAWFSRADVREGGLGYELIDARWRPEMAFDTAICGAKTWLNRLRLVCQLPSGAITDTWLTSGTIDGFTFTPLPDALSLLSESRAMNNCADQYSDKIARDRCRLFSVRRGGITVATLEVSGHPLEPTMLSLSQLKGRNNLAVSPAIWRVAYRWLSEQPNLSRAQTLPPPPRKLSPRIWHALMEPYRKARSGAPWIPRTPSATAISKLDAEITELARAANVSSWMFR